MGGPTDWQTFCKKRDRSYQSSLASDWKHKITQKSIVTFDEIGSKSDFKSDGNGTRPSLVEVLAAVHPVHEVEVAHLVVARGPHPDGVVLLVLHGAPGGKSNEG